ncbi:RNA polymerase sigma factor [Georgenia muralis]|uniref:RNA polymerase sigma factor (Sigma-70 family) n=1 Tax=Georgenia muralis TaxID=154117 RepID=A0A3N4Z6L0_9MICO|nr:sigma factor [Georgenia muralis]RPF29049.1 RNA polymerase sigma factor (sigma-70 family) [Georgenia muralis]
MEDGSIEELDWSDLRRVALAVAREQGAGESAEDVASEALTRLWVNLEEVREPRAWVRQVTRRLAIDQHRAGPADGWTDLPNSSPEPGERPFPAHLAARSPSGKVAARDDLERALAVVNDVERDLLLGQSAGYSTRELAERCRYTERSVRVKLSVARRKIRQAFPGFVLD